MLRIDAGSSVGDFVVAGATYDEGSADPGDEELRITVAEGPAGTPSSFFDLHAAEPGLLPYRLIPRFFRVVTGPTGSFLPSTASVRILFQGAGTDGAGGVDEQTPLVDWTGDISRFDALDPGLRFCRFQVEFELERARGSADTEPVNRQAAVPFVF
jgi:hypothetical protein